jgi:broad specificity phosphatase PhoE
MQLKRPWKFLFAIGLISLMGNPALASFEAGAPILFLVRHAEKGDGADPPLTEAGQRRAQTLARMLAESGIGHIHSTDYVRTLETAAPVAERLGLEIRIYDPARLQELADSLLREGGRHLVVGHSNTTPDLVALLGGEPGDAIEDAWEYDRLYLVIPDSHGKTSEVLMRYGAPSTNSLKKPD